MRLLSLLIVAFSLTAIGLTTDAPGQDKKPKDEKFLDPIDTKVPNIGTDIEDLSAAFGYRTVGTYDLTTPT